MKRTAHLQTPAVIAKRTASIRRHYRKKRKEERSFAGDTVKGSLPIMHDVPADKPGVKAKQTDRELELRHKIVDLLGRLLK